MHQVNHDYLYTIDIKKKPTRGESLIREIERIMSPKPNITNVRYIPFKIVSKEINVKVKKPLTNTHLQVINKCSNFSNLTRINH
jgi:hypothetical protein